MEHVATGTAEALDAEAAEQAIRADLEMRGGAAPAALDDAARDRAALALGLLLTAASRAEGAVRFGAGQAEISAAMEEIGWCVEEARAALGLLVAAPEAAAPVEPQPEPAAMAPAPAPRSLYSPPPEGHLAAATRAAEAVKALADQALLGFQTAPREAGVLCEMLGGMQRRADDACHAYVQYAVALQNEAPTR